MCEVRVPQLRLVVMVALDSTWQSGLLGRLLIDETLDEK